MTALAASILAMGGLGAFFAAALAIADKKLRVEEDPRIGMVNDALPGANCGACGQAGCAAFAEAVVQGTAPVNGCPVGGQDCAEDVARIMGVDAGQSVRHVARLMCRGAIGVAREKADYVGPSQCAVQDLVSGGSKACQYGCLGGGDCVEVCNFGALVMGEDGLPHVFDDLCTACAACVTACPRDLFELHPIDREFFVFCKSHDDPKTAKAACDAACTGCGICARKSEGAIVVQDGLAVIDYDKLDPGLIPLDKCKTGAIGWLHPQPVPVAEATPAADEPSAT